MEIRDVPVRVQLVLEVIILIGRGGDGNYIVDINNEDSDACSSLSTIDAPFTS